MSERTRKCVNEWVSGWVRKGERGREGMSDRVSGWQIERVIKWLWKMYNENKVITVWKWVKLNFEKAYHEDE